MTLRAHHHRFSHSDNAQHLRLEVLAPLPFSNRRNRASTERRFVFSCSQGLAEATKDSRFAKFRIPTDFSRLSTKSDLLQGMAQL